MAVISRVSEKGQVTLPKVLRDKLGIQPGTRLEFRLLGDGTIRMQILAKGSASLFGLLAKPGEPALSLEDMDAAIAASVRDRAGRRR